MGGLCATLVAVGCGRLGPTVLKGEHLDYNIALQKSNDQQLLLNLVRMRYRDNPYFLEVSSIASSLSISGTGSVSPTFSENAGVTSRSNALSASVTYTESPIISYTPMQGGDFVTRMLKPLTVEELLFLANSGWSLHKIMHICVQKVDGIYNTNRASGATPASIELGYDEFHRIASLLEKLRLQNLVTLGYEVKDGTTYPVLRFDEQAEDSPEAAELRQRLRLNPDMQSYWVSEQIVGTAGDTIVLSMRSVLGMLLYLSRLVDVPAADIQKGRVVTTRDSFVEPFDWQRGIGLFRVGVAESFPDNAAVAVPYRGHWFYIDDSDVTSKATFSFISQLFSLKAGSDTAVKPTLTIPLGA